MADIERRLAAGDRIELPVDLIFGNGVKRRRRLVEHEEGRILVKCAGDGDLLRLAAGRRETLVVHVVVEIGVHALGQALQPRAEPSLRQQVAYGFIGGRMVEAHIFL